MKISKDHIWGPMPDKEMQNLAATYIRNFKLHDVFLENGACRLGDFTPQSKIYILVHGHAQMPLFSNSNGKWSATQLARMLEADGLPKDQREIELLVCHAGESVNDKKTGAKLLNINSQAQAAKAQGKSIDKLVGLFSKVAGKGTGPSFFESDPEKLLLPLAAELAQALKHLGYTNFRVISYKCPVAQYSEDGEVYLDLTKKGGRWGVKAKLHPTYRVVWQ